MAAILIIILKKVFHRGAEQILIQFDYNEDLILLTRSLEGIRWSKRKNSWYVKNTAEHLKAISSLYKGKATIDINQLKLDQPLKRQRLLNQHQRDFLNGYVKYLRGRRYSVSTIRTYSYLIANFVEHSQNKAIAALSNSDVDRFAQDILAAKNYSISTHRQFVSALKLFKNYYPECAIDNTTLERPKKSRILPTVLSEREIIELLQHTKNLKHRAILALIYSSGLRISELLNLELTHISIDRKQLFIKNSKGRKDRYVVLSESFIPLLKNYYFTYKPVTFFVEGAKGGQYSASSIRSFLKVSCRNMGLTKKVTPHTLRHSYATHLMENGVGLRYIQELLGHARPETTMIYTHVAKKDLIQIESPLDTAFKRLAKIDNSDKKSLLSRN